MSETSAPTLGADGRVSPHNG
ncbi:MAG: hypothetical protein QOJ12_2445, partial [Thermoleophilales bacterium]|nr:hypothetical protein [Thermoleophilales bacterium]